MIELPLFHNRKTGKPIRVRLTGHVLLSGSTGSGKSGAMLHIVHCISKLSSSRDKLTILDYKGSKDWKELRGVTIQWRNQKKDLNKRIYYFVNS